MTSTSEAAAAIDSVTRRHASSGKPVEIDRSAEAILCRYPGSGLSIAEILKLLAESARCNGALLVRKGVPVT